VTDFSQTQALPPIQERPLVTFALFAYNQEKYIRQAVEGAFAQTYEPLEIILSDDCSVDETFEIIKNMAAEYKGPHNIALNRNRKNLGISTHVRMIHEISKGEFIIHAAGDDISYPERTIALVTAFFSMPIKPSIVLSNSYFIDEHGEEIAIRYPNEKKANYRKNSKNPINFIGPGSGSTLALSKELVLAFDAPNPKLIIEDNLLVTRANFLGGTLYVPNILVGYRVGHGSASNPFGSGFVKHEPLLKFYAEWNKERMLGVSQFLIDAEKIGFKKEDNKEVFTRIEKYYDSLTQLEELITADFFHSTIAFLKEMFKVRRADYQIYVPLEYFRPLKLYIFRWLPFLREWKNTLNLSNKKSRGSD
jgi:glycosyltransferase involved in cell wall biosynthesis